MEKYRVSGFPTLGRTFIPAMSDARIVEHLHDMRTELWALLQCKKITGQLPLLPPMRRIVPSQVNLVLIGRALKRKIWFIRDGETMVSWTEDDTRDTHGRPC